MISSAEPPETPSPASLTTARIRVHILDLETLANDASAVGEPGVAALARNLSSQLCALLRATPAAPSTPPPATMPNTGV